MFPGIDGVRSLWRSRHSLRVFLLVSVAMHAALIIGLPDFLPQFADPGVNVLEVSFQGPQPLPVAEARPDPPPAPPRPEPLPKEKPRAAPEVKPAPAASKPASDVSAPGPALPAQDPEIVGSFAVAPHRGPAPATTAPDPATEAARQQFTPPSFDAAYLSNPAPRYPPAARRAGEQGTVTLRVLVKRDGLPQRVEIERSSGYQQLDSAAQDAVWGWRFVPGRQGTDPIEQWLQVPVRFRLEDAR